MSEIIIYNQQMFVSEKELPEETRTWARYSVGQTETHVFWNTGPYSFWTINDRTELKELMAADAAKAPVENGLKNKRTRKGLVKRMNAREIECAMDALWETLSPEEQAEWEAKAKAEATGPDGKIIHGHLPWSEARYMALEHHEPFERVWD